MSKEKQIEEILKIINKPCFEILNEAGVIDRECPFPYECAECTARNIYNAGYRKQSEGKWIEKKRYYSSGKILYHYQCSLCGIHLATQANYCPVCGAKMKGGEG